jgi:hypothetical protein
VLLDTLIYREYIYTLIYSPVCFTWLLGSQSETGGSAVGCCIFGVCMLHASWVPLMAQQMAGVKPSR